MLIQGFCIGSLKSLNLHVVFNTYTKVIGSLMGSGTCILFTYTWHHTCACSWLKMYCEQVVKNCNH